MTVTISSGVHIVPPRGYYVTKRIVRVLRDQPQSSSTYSALYSTEPKRDGSTTAISPYSPGSVSSVGSAYPASTYPGDSSHLVGSSIRVGSVYPPSTGYPVNPSAQGNPYIQTVASIPVQYAQYQIPQATRPSYSYSPYFASVASQSSPMPSYRTASGVPFSQVSLNPDPYESFSAINPDLRLDSQN